jgi:5-(hydroxymethyl)furfural/furfural oxidase
MDYDYVIVGGGSAGCVLANRLSARAANRVLLIESGQDTPPGQVPADILETFPKAALNPAYKWMKLLAYTRSLTRNVPQMPVLYDQGRVMGGGSSINFQAANRGAPEDYDEWAALGAQGWDWAGVLPYFRKLESDANFGGDLHGKDGPVPIERMTRAEWCGFSQATARALQELGYRFLDDQNGPFVDGYFAATQNNRPGQRVSAAMAYLDAGTRARANLRILSHAHVSEILFEGSRAVGVTVETRQGQETVRAGEIVLAAGAVHSPAMLMRSGIGPSAELQAQGIEVRADLPGVGSNLRDHPGVPVIAYLKGPARVAMGHRPLQISFRYSSGVAGCPPADMFGAVFCRAGWHGVGRRIGMIMTWVNKSYSAGRVSLKTRDWREEPQVELNLCEDERDITRLKSGMRFVASLFDHKALRQATREPSSLRFSTRGRTASAVTFKNQVLMGAAGMLLAGPSPVRRALMRHAVSDGPPLSELFADETVLEEFVRSTTMGIKHLSCTCRMGREDDPLAVTLADGRVKGIEALRVVDASIMPSLPRCNTNLTTLMLAEKIADTMLNA